MPWIFSGSREYPLAEDTPQKNVTDSCLIAHFAHLKMSPSFWAMLKKFYDVGIMIIVILFINEHIIMYGQYSWAGLQCYPSSSGRYLGSFWVKKEHIEIGISWGGCWTLWGVRLPLSHASWRKLVAIHLGKSCGSCEDMGYLLEGWSLEILMDDGFVQVFWVEAYPPFHLPSWGRLKSWPMVWAQSVWWWLPAKPSLPTPFWFLLCTQWELSIFHVVQEGL